MAGVGAGVPVKQEESEVSMEWDSVKEEEEEAE